MNVFVAGGTGVLGRGLLRQLRERGHHVFALARNSENEQRIRQLGGEPRRADLFDAGSLARAAEGCEVVIHAATAIPSAQRPRPKDWVLNDRIRREGTRALTEAAAKVGAKLYLQQSIAWLARPADGSPFDEDSPPRPDEITQSALDGEQIAQEAGAKHGFRVSVLRCGWFYGPDARHTRMFGQMLVARKLPIVGDGNAIWALLHTEDAAGAFVAAAEARQSGLWHVVDNEPVSSAEFLTYFAQKLGAKPPRRVPIWLAKIAAGKRAVEFMTASTRTTNTRFRQATGWMPQFPSYREGIEQIVAAWRAERFL